jgi:hypothetical protein
VFAQIRVGVVGQTASEVFSLTVSSPSALSQAPSGTFVTSTLVLDRFDWLTLRRRVEKLLAQCGDCRDWSEVIQRLSGFLRHNDTT